MRVYVINVDTEVTRLQNFEKTYPKCLPEYTVWKAKTGKDVEKPDWWKSSANRWSLVQNFIDILSTDTDEDILIFEDDCTFTEGFEEEYNAFLNEVPEDWDMLYLGAYHVAPPIQVSPNVLRLRDSICGHAIIYRNRIKQELIKYYQEPKWGCRHMPDQRRAQVVASGKFKAYSPLINICGQSASYSILAGSERKARWYDTFKYINLDGVAYKCVRGVLSPAKEDTVNVGLRGGFGNCLLHIGLGKWAESQGFNVKYYAYKLGHDRCILDLLTNFNIELSGHKEFQYVDREYLNKSEQVRQMTNDYYCFKCSFHPECLTYLNMDHSSTDAAIGIHIRRGDYLDPTISAKTFGMDLCNTKYFENVKQALAQYDLPVKIFSDDISAIPEHIKDLFPDAQYNSGDTWEDFNALSACKVIVTYSSTFSGCAAYLNTDAVVYYPPNLVKSFRKSDWNLISLD